MNLNKHPELSSGKKTGRKLSTPAIIGFIFAALCVVALLIASPYLFSKSKVEAIVKIPANATEQMLTDTLTRYFGKDYAGKVTKAVGALGADLNSRYGAYKIDKGMSPLSAARILARGEQTPVKITINGFRTRELMAQRIARKLNFKAEDLLKVMNDPAVMGKYGLKPEQAMALFIDDTYLLNWNATPAELIEKIGAHYKEVWGTERTAKAKALGLTPADVMTVCSIADEESQMADEKGKITRLYVNRIHKGMKLQADPTVKFAIGDFSIKRITRPMLSTDSPYNTYMYAGLPPGPIRTTSVKTIDALLGSKPSDDLYMCAREDFSGYHNFTSTYAEHEANARRYQAELNRRNIK